MQLLITGVPGGLKIVTDENTYKRGARHQVTVLSLLALAPAPSWYPCESGTLELSVQRSGKLLPPHGVPVNSHDAH